MSKQCKVITIVCLILIFVSVTLISVFMKENTFPSFESLIAHAYQFDPNSTTVLTDEGLSDPWKIGVNKEEYENSIKYNPIEKVKNTVKLSDYGESVLKDGVYDDTKAFYNAISAIKSFNGDFTMLELSNNTLDFIEGMSGDGSGFGIVIDGVKNLLIKGNNTTIVFHGNTNGILLRNCENVYFQDINIDWGRVPFSMGTIVSTDGQTFVVKVDENYPIDSDTEIQGLLEYNKKTLAPFANGNDIYNDVKSVELIENQTLKITFNKKYNKSPVGTIAILRHQLYSYNGIQVENSKNTYLEHVNLYSAPGMGLLVKSSENLYLNSFNVMLKPNTNRLMSSNADAIHLMETKGEVIITNGLYENCGDDALNVHGFYQTITHISSDRKEVTAVNPRGYTYVPSVGDSVMITDPTTLKTTQIVTVKEIKSNAKKGFTVRFNEELVKEVDLKYSLINYSAASSVRFENNVVRNKRCRGVLVQTGKEAVVKNNLFYNLGDAAILLTSDLGSWYEGMPTNNITISDNKIIQVNLRGGAKGAISASCYTVDNFDAEAGAMKNHTITNNLIANSGHSGMYLASISNLSVMHNLISNVGLLGQKYGVMLNQIDGLILQKNELILNSSIKSGIATSSDETKFTIKDNVGLELEDFIVSVDKNETQVYKIANSSINVLDNDLSDWIDKGTSISMIGSSNTEHQRVELSNDDYKINSVKFAYDDFGIYVSYDVFDDKLSWASASTPWNGDSVEIFMSANTEYASNMSALKVNDPSCLQILMTSSISGGSNVMTARTSLEILEQKDKILLNFWVKEDGKGYAGEVFIPFEVVPGYKDKIAAGEMIAMCIRFGDYDTDSESLVQVSNVVDSVELNKYVPKRMPKILFKGEA